MWSKTGAVSKRPRQVEDSFLHIRRLGQKPGDFFGFFGQTETVYRKNKEVILEVKPLPMQDQPEGFSNAVGSFTLSSSLNKSTGATGDAVSLQVKLAGTGNLKEIPDIPLPATRILRSIHPSVRKTFIRWQGIRSAGKSSGSM